MSAIHAHLPPGVRFELAFASVIPGKETQLFTEYFPKVGPIIASLGATQVASFAVLESSADIEAPTMGALFQWPTVCAYQDLHQHPEFLNVKHLRDEALSQLWNGHFFAVDKYTAATFDTEKIYAMIVANPGVSVENAELSLGVAADSTNQDYQGRVFSIGVWSDVAQALLDSKTGLVEVFRVKFNPAKPSPIEEGR